MKKIAIIGIVVVIAVVVVAAAVYVVTLPGVAKPAGKIKVALIMDAPLNDVGWNAAAWEGMTFIRDQLGVEISYSESVLESDAERVVREYAVAGYNLIIGHGFGFKTALFSTGEDYPNTAFAWAIGFEVAANVASYNLFTHEAGYLAGILAGGLTKTGIIGGIGAFPEPDVNREVNGFILGAQSVRPNVTVLTNILGTWVDTGKGKEAALSMIDAGADFICQVASSAGLGIIQAAKERNVYVTGDVSDQNVLGPNVVIVSVLMKHSKPIIEMTKDVIAGTFKGKFYNYSMVDGGADISPYHGLESVIPQELKDKVKKAREDIISGKLVIPMNEVPIG